MSNYTREILDMIEECEESDSRLSSWERTFLDSISRYVGSGGFLSANQDGTLRRIHEKVMR